MAALLGEQTDLSQLMKIGSMMGKLGAEPDPRCDLLYALKPFLREERKARIEEAARILKMLRFAAIFKEGGL